jgi:predicted transcriptional regulator
MDGISVDSLSLVQRLALLSIATAVADGEAPVDSRDVREQSGRLLDAVETEVVGTPNERDVMRALSALGSEPYIDEQQTDQSPAGKGRPTYTLTVDVTAVFDVLAEDDQLASAVARVRQ